MDRKTIAKNYFRNGLNCAQSVLTSFKDEMDIEETTLLKLASGFGGGMGELQKTCGAVTGANMVIGLVAENLNPSDKDSRESINLQIRELDSEFRKIHGSTQCRELLGINLLSEKDADKYEERNLKENVCEKCIQDAVSLVESITHENII